MREAYWLRGIRGATTVEADDALLALDLADGSTTAYGTGQRLPHMVVAAPDASAAFAANTVSAHPQSGVRALIAMAARMTSPPQSPREVLDELRARYGMDEVSQILAPRLPAG